MKTYIEEALSFIELEEMCDYLCDHRDWLDCRSVRYLLSC